MNATPSERRLQCIAAVHTRWAFEGDRTAATAPARDAFMRKFEDQVDPDHKLTPQERSTRADSLRKAHFASLARKSAVARRRRNQK
jgi:hypothetical protein